MPNADTPYKYFPQAMLPQEYGGQAGTLTDLKTYWLEKLKDKRDYLIDGNKWQIDKTKKSLMTKDNPLEDSAITHSFKSLEID